MQPAAPGEAGAVEPMTVVATTSDRIDAHLKVAALQDAGLRARLSSDDAGGLHLDLALVSTHPYRILVPAVEHDTARALLVELDRGDHALAAPPDELDAIRPRRRIGMLWGLVAVCIVAFVAFQVLVHGVNIAGF